jgi:hypothetical protein
MPATIRDAAPRARPRRSDAVRARFASPPSRLAQALLSLSPIGVPVVALAWLAVGGILDRLGHPGAALDDSFIHFQYARAIAEGHPFRYHAGEPHTMGATSALWPLLLAPFYLLGCTGLDILWPAWALSFLALGFLAREVYLLSRPLAGEHAAVGAAAMVLAFSPFTWCAGSGMEVVPFAFCLVRAVRRSSDWVEAGARTPSLERELVALAFLAPLMRPEGALASVVIAAALVGAPSPRRGGRLVALIPLFAAVAPQLLSAAVTGHLQSNTAQVKLLPGNPYYRGDALVAAVRENMHTLVHTLLQGEVWSAEFIPHGSMPFAFAGLASLLWRAHASRRPVLFRAVVTLALALAIAVPCFYVSFLWNRLRYLWPFAPFWLVGLACLTRTFGDVLGAIRPRLRAVGPVAAGFITALLAMKLDGTLDDLAGSASGIDRQQVALGKWARDAIPPGGRIGVNDTGAIAYFGEHPTFDVVGLTTEGEGRYWVAGAASRFEHYERLVLDGRAAQLPTHFIVYPEWMALPQVLGTRLFDATVTDSTILGGQTMVAYEANYSLLGTGERPWTRGLDYAELIDAVDVADLESEAQHQYALLGAADGDEVVTSADDPLSGSVVADGGRRERARERFRVHLGVGARARAALGIVRLEPSEPTRVDVLVDGAAAASFVAFPGEWSEQAFAIAGLADGAVVELVPDTGRLTTYHYWFFPRDVDGR